ncbi:MAG: hypothetical protein QOH62_1164 [Solirubrobacteraceae bacterium]|jgi:hypothetical protein|nr:hypothetical protein [Solirubrobacteraceae bacterium]
MPRQPRTHLRSLAVLACAAVVALLALGSSAGAQPTAHAARSCSPPKYPGLGYFTSLEVSHVTCATGRKVTVAHYRCRTRHGRSGRCTSKVLGYSCTEGHRNSIPTEYTARVTCKSGTRKVVYTYQQNTG